MADPIDELPTPPSRNDAPATFISRANAFIAALVNFVTQVNIVARAFNFNSTNSTSATSLTIGIGAQSLTVDASKSYLPGQTIKIARTSDGTKWMLGDVISYNSGTGALAVTVSKIQGSGTFTDWTITLSATDSINDGDKGDITVSGSGSTWTLNSDAIPDASASVKGIVELATSAELITGTDTSRVPSVDVLRQGLIARGTVQATTSGTSKDFTGIPSWVKRIIVQMDSISTNGSSNLIVQIGDSGGIEVTGYSSTAVIVTAGPVVATFTTGFGLTGQVAGASVLSGNLILTLMDAATNTWTASLGGNAANAAHSGGGVKSLSSTLDRIRLTTVNGTDTFDAGSVNIQYE